MFKLSLIALTLLGAAATGHASSSAQQVVNQISQFGVTYQVNDNQAALHGTDCAALGADYAACNRATITLINNGPALTDKHWAIYMSNVHQTLRVDNDQFKMTHLVGDLTRLSRLRSSPALARANRCRFRSLTNTGNCLSRM